MTMALTPSVDPRVQLVYHAVGAELWINNRTGEYFWRCDAWREPRTAGTCDAWADGSVDRQTSPYIAIRLGTGADRRLLRGLLRAHPSLKRDVCQAEPIEQHQHAWTNPRPDLAVFLNILKAQLPCNGSQLRPIVLGLLAPAPPRALAILQTLETVVLTHVPTAQYFLQTVAGVTATPRLLKRKRCQQLEAHHLDHISIRVRLGTTGQEEVKLLPRALAQVSLLQLAAMAAVRPLQLGEPGDPLVELAALLAEHCEWLTRDALSPDTPFPLWRAQLGPERPVDAHSSVLKGPA
jgi:hypothetical protein